MFGVNGIARIATAAQSCSQKPTWVWHQKWVAGFLSGTMNGSMKGGQNIAMKCFDKVMSKNYIVKTMKSFDKNAAQSCSQETLQCNVIQHAVQKQITYIMGWSTSDQLPIIKVRQRMGEKI